jgi:hypothetical protein
MGVPLGSSLSQVWTLFQTAAVKGQSLQRWVAISGTERQRRHSVSCGQPLTASMSAVRSFPCRASQENNLHSGSVFAVQIFWARNLGWLPMNWAWYAELVLYLPSELSVHEMESGWSGVSCKVATMSQICKYYDSCRGCWA